MRRFLVFFLAIQIMVLLLAGCSIPFFGRSSDKPDKTGANDMIGLNDSTGGNGNAAADAGMSGTDHMDPDSYGKSEADGSLNDPGTLTGDAAGSIFASEPEDGEEHYPYAGIGSGISEDTGDDGTGPYGTGVLAAQSVTKTAWSEPRRPVTVYYQDEDGCLVPMTRWIQPQLGIARAAVSLAIDSPLTREETAYYGVYPVIPEGTGILGIDIRNGTAVIDFSRDLLNYGTAWSERNIIAAVVYTLTEFDTVDKVRILINGYPVGVLKYGTDLSEPLGREDMMINTEMVKVSPEPGKEKIDVYFMKRANEDFVYAVPVSLAVESGEADLEPDTLVRLLLGTVPGGGIYTEIPEGVYLRGSYVYDGTAYLDFSGEFINYGGTAREEAILKQITYTLRQCDGIRKIKITVDGRSVELPEGTYISAGLVIPATVNDVMDRG
ncbi:MAG TPA: GerMN domain-containing protein [Clostridia bacterium]